MKSQHAAHPSPCSANLNFLPQVSERRLLISAPAAPRGAGAEEDALQPLGLSGRPGTGEPPSAHSRWEAGVTRYPHQRNTFTAQHKGHVIKVINACPCFQTALSFNRQQN